MATVAELEEGYKVLYLVPMLQLVSDKQKELEVFDKSETEKDKIGSERIIVKTFEDFYRTALMKQGWLDQFSLAIVDEFHLLYDKTRGFNLEKALILLKMSNIRIICLSATFEDKKEVSSWLNAKLIEIDEEFRPIKIKYEVLDLTKISKKDENDAVFNHIKKNNLTPCIFFCNTKPITRSRALEFCEKLPQKIKPEIIEKAFKTIKTQKITPLEKDLAKCLSHGVAFHNAILNNDLKNYVIDFFNNGSVDYLFATTTLAFGVNTPAASVVLYDLSFHTGGISSEPIPVYLFIQMAGRAGRSIGTKKITEGHAFVVAKKPQDLIKLVPTLLGRKLEPAKSHIIQDDYFGKCILELIHSSRNHDTHIRDFFVNSLYNFQSEQVENLYSKFDLNQNIHERIKFLETNDFMKMVGAPGYMLTPLGKAVIDFLFKSSVNYTLESFSRLNEMVSRYDKIIILDFEFIYEIIKIFDLKLGKERGKNEEIVNYFLSKSITTIKDLEYTAFAFWNCWLNNIDEIEIESKYLVFSGQIRWKANEFVKILTLVESLARSNNVKIPKEYETFKKRMRYGVKESEVIFSGSGIARDSVRSLSEFSLTFKNQHMLKGNNILEILIDFLNKHTSKELGKIMEKNISNFGPKKTEQILKIVEANMIKKIDKNNNQ